MPRPSMPQEIVERERETTCTASEKDSIGDAAHQSHVLAFMRWHTARQLHTIRGDRLATLLLLIITYSRQASTDITGVAQSLSV